MDTVAVVAAPIVVVAVLMMCIGRAVVFAAMRCGVMSPAVVRAVGCGLTRSAAGCPVRPAMRSGVYRKRTFADARCMRGRNGEQEREEDQRCKGFFHGASGLTGCASSHFFTRSCTRERSTGVRRLAASSTFIIPLVVGKKVR